MKRIIGVGDTDIDLYIKVPKIAGYDEKVLGELIGEFPGGMIGNFCSAVARFGHSNVEIISAIGDDHYGQITKKALDELKVGTTGLQINKNSNTYFCVVFLDSTGEKSLTIVPTGSMYPDSSKIDLELIQSADYLHTTGGNKQLLEYLCQNKGENTILSVDLETTMLKEFLTNESLLSKIDILFTNKQTITSLFPRLHLEEGIKELAFKGFKSVILTAGKDGSYSFDRNQKKIIHQPAFPVKPVDTTGAGDCFSAIYLSALADGYCMDSAMKFASAGAAISILSIGARSGLPTKLEVETLLKNYQSKT
jgi:ribokinase